MEFLFILLILLLIFNVYSVKKKLDQLIDEQYLLSKKIDSQILMLKSWLESNPKPTQAIDREPQIETKVITSNQEEIEAVPPVAEVIAPKPDPVIEPLTEAIIPDAKPEPQVNADPASSVQPEQDMDSSHGNADEPLTPQQMYEQQLRKKRSAYEARFKSSHESSAQASNVQSIWQKLAPKTTDTEKFIGENLINKIGIVILILGISYFIKYSIDRNWINELERLGIGVLAGGILMSIGHYLRRKYQNFAIVFLAGGLAVLNFAVFMAFQRYHLISQEVAFGLFVLLAGIGCLMSVAYNQQMLGVMAVLGGFAAPFLASTGEGNVKILFSYILILSTSVAIMSYYKRWNIMQLVSLVTTMLIVNGTLIYKYYEGTDLHLMFLGFVTAFFLLNIVVTIINSFRAKNSFNNFEVSLIIISTFQFLIQGLYIIHQIYPDYKGLYVILLALFFFVLGYLSMKRFKLTLITSQIFLGITVALTTICVPVQFSDFVIPIVWALQAAFITYVFTRKPNSLLATGVVILYLLSLAGLGYMYINDNELASTQNMTPFFNTHFWTTVSVALSMYIGGVLLSRYGKPNENNSFIKFVNQIKPILYVKSAVIFYFVLLFEWKHFATERYSSDYSVYSVLMLYNFVLVMIVLGYILYIKRKYSQGVSIVSLLFIFISVIFASWLPHRELELLSTGEYLEMNVCRVLAIPIFIITCFYYYILHRYRHHNNEISAVFSVATLTKLFVFSFVLLMSIHLAWTYVSLQVAIGGYRYSDYDLLVNQVVRAGLPILWGVIALILIVVGFKYQWRNIRISAIVLLIVTIIKLFVYDIQNVNALGKIIAFILLGILLLIISFTYQKIKKILIDENN